MINYNNLRKRHYRTQAKKLKKRTNIDILDIFKNPYTFLKAKLFIELSSIIVFFLQFTKITPNFVTSVYIFLGFLSGVFLASNNDTLILISLFLLVFKNVIDWSDGLLARIKNKSSNLGDILDRWGSTVGYNSFIFGFGFYLYNDGNNNEIFLLLIFSIIFLKSIDLKDFNYHLIGYKIIKELNKKEAISYINLYKKVSKNNKNNKFQKTKTFILTLLDDNRSNKIDPIVLLILIDNFYYNIFFLNYIYYFIFIKNLIFFFGGMYMICFKNYSTKISK